MLRVACVKKTYMETYTAKFGAQIVEVLPRTFRNVTMFRYTVPSIDFFEKW